MAFSTVARVTNRHPVATAKNPTMAQPIAEIHIPLVSTGLAPGATWPRSTDIIPDDYPFPWIGEVEEYLGEREVAGTFEVHDDGA